MGVANPSVRQLCLGRFGACVFSSFQGFLALRTLSKPMTFSDVKNNCDREHPSQGTGPRTGPTQTTGPIPISDVFQEPCALLVSLPSFLASFLSFLFFSLSLSLSRCLYVAQGVGVSR